MQYRSDPSVLNADFLAYSFLSPDLQHQFRMHEGSGSVVSHIRVGDCSKFELNLPPIKEQERIAGILSSLDKKIELNRQINATLESMAQALFKSWFVDFDPVIDNALAAGNSIPEPFQARADKRAAMLAAASAADTRSASATDNAHPTQAAPHTKPGTTAPATPLQPLPADLRALFPDSFVFNEEMGWVPEGWMSREIGEVFSLLGGHPFKSGNYVEGGRYGVVTIKNVQDAKFVEDCSSRLNIVPEKMKPHCYLDGGEVLMSLTGNVGRVCIVSPGEYLLNQRVARLVGKNGVSDAFTYFFFRQKEVFGEMIRIAKGTAQQNLSPIETVKIRQVLPCEDFIVKTQNLLDTIFERVLANNAQTITLSRVRDQLLPKLLSGQIQMPEADRLAAEAL